MEFKNGRCLECLGIETCDKYCSLHAGYALKNMLENVTVVNSRIGEYEKSVRGGKTDLIVSGHRIDTLEDTPIHILTSIKTSLDMSKKFNNLYNRNIVQILNEYLEYINQVKTEYGVQLLEELKGINNNKVLVIPFKPNVTYEVELEINDKVKTHELVLDHIEWKTNKETARLETFLVFRQEFTNAIGKFYRLQYSDYMKKFRLSKSSMYIDIGSYNTDMIETTNFGLFKPIEITDGYTKLAIDGTYLYHISNRISIIGQWNKLNKIQITSKVPEILKSKTYLIIKENINIIKAHKNYIAPYNVVDANKICL